MTEKWLALEETVLQYSLVGSRFVLQYKLYYEPGVGLCRDTARAGRVGRARGAQAGAGRRKRALGVLVLGAQAGRRRAGQAAAARGAGARQARGRGCMGARGAGAGRGLGVLLANGLCTRCTRPVFDPV